MPIIPINPDVNTGRKLTRRVSIQPLATPDAEVDSSLGEEVSLTVGTARGQSAPATSDLSNADWLDYSLDASLAAKLKIAGFDGSASGRHRVYVWDYMRWTALPDPDDASVQSDGGAVCDARLRPPTCRSTQVREV